MLSTVILLVFLVVVALFFVSIYNGLVTARNGYKNAFSQIDVQLTRRHDLIPNLVEIAKGYIKHERETLEAVIQARNSAVSGLRAASANPGDAGAVGFADHYVPRAGLPAFTAAVVADGVAHALATHAQQPPPSPLAAARDWIDHCYAADTVGELVAALRGHQRDARAEHSRGRRDEERP